MLDIYNEDGTPAGYTASKKEAHEKGLWHRAAHVWFVNNQKEILLQRRAKNRESHPDKYDISAAGHLSAGDSMVEGALREIEEELGIKISEEELIYLGDISKESTQHNGTYINKEHDSVYLVKKDIPIEDFTISQEEVDHIKYIPLDEFKKWIVEEKPDLLMHTKEFEMIFNYLDKN